jgi:hypothetical protein
VTVGVVAFVIERDRSQADLLLGVPELPERWRAWARESLGR